MPASHKHQFEVHHWEDPLLPFILHIGNHLSQDDPDFSNFHDGLELLYVTEGRGTLFTGGAVIAYVQQLRCRRASELLLNTDERIATVARLCGFDSPSYFTKTFARLIGMRPAEYRATHAEGHSQK